MVARFLTCTPLLKQATHCILQTWQLPADDITKSFADGGNASSNAMALSGPSSSTSIIEQAGDATTVKSDANRAGTAKRLSRFVHDSHAAAVTPNAKADHALGQERTTGQHDNLVPMPAASSQPALPPGLRLFKASKQGLGRCVP